MLAITLKPSPAVSITSPSIFSVAVERTPLAPRTASISSSRVGGRSKRTVTSKSSRRRRPASGISRVTRTLSGTVASLILLEELAEDGLEDSAVSQVLHLDRRVDARPDLELPNLAVIARGPDGKLRAGREVCEALDIVGLVTREAEGVGVLAVCELQGQDAHPDQVGAVYPLEALRDDRPDTEQERSLGRPVTRGAGAVLLAREHDEGDVFLPILHGRLVDGGLLAVGEVNGVASLPGDELVAQPDVAEGAAHHHLVVTAPGSVGVEVPRVNALGDQVLTGRALRGDRASRGDVVRSDRVADLDEDAGSVYVLEVCGLRAQALEEGGLLDVGRVGVPLVEVAGGHVPVVPLPVPGVDVGVLAPVDLRFQRALDLLCDLRLRGPDVLEVDGAAVFALSERLVGEVYVHRAG